VEIAVRVSPRDEVSRVPRQGTHGMPRPSVVAARILTGKEYRAAARHTWSAAARW
jgi:hypothetical protein